MGERLSSNSTWLEGIDLSAKMVSIAEKKQIYHALHVGDMIGFLQSAAPYDLVIAADVLVYVGNLSAFIESAFQALNAGGTLAFTVQTFEGEGFLLGQDMRYAHSESYLRAVMKPYFDIKALKKITPRLDGGKPIDGLLISALKTAVL
jgi:predicted TPR repeat methyltransferase